MLIIKLLSILIFIGSVVWFTVQPDYEPAIAILTSLSAFITAWFIDEKQKQQTNQSQSVATNSVGIQAGGDINMGSIHTSGSTQDAE